MKIPKRTHKSTRKRHLKNLLSYEEHIEIHLSVSLLRVAVSTCDDDYVRKPAGGIPFYMTTATRSQSEVSAK